MTSLAQRSAIERLISASKYIQSLCDSHAEEPRPLALRGLEPILPALDPEWLLPSYQYPSLPGRTRDSIIAAISECVDSVRTHTVQEFHSTVRQMKSLQLHGGESDFHSEMKVCKRFERAFEAHMAKIQQRIARLMATRREFWNISPKKTSGLGSLAIAILERAFAVDDHLTTAECTLIARKAGITHQQVRTWYQNKRNRGRKGGRTASLSEVQQRVTEAVIPPERRVISALPKRAAPSTHLPPPPPSSRPVRGLPRRAQHASPSPTPSGSSISSLDSIHPTGGFTSFVPPLPSAEPTFHNPNALTGPYTILGETPAFNFTPPTPLNVNFDLNFDTNMTFNLDDILPPWSDADFTSLLNSVLSDPTLAGSPVFSDPLDSPGDGITGMEGEGWIGYGSSEDFFASIDQYLVPEYGSSESGSSFKASPVVVDNRYNNPSPADTLGDVTLLDLSFLDQPYTSTETRPNPSPPMSEPSSPSSSGSHQLISPIQPHTLSRTISTSTCTNSDALVAIRPFRRRHQRGRMDVRGLGVRL